MKLLSDAGYFSEAQIHAAEAKGMGVCCSPDPWRVTEPSPWLSGEAAARRTVHAVHATTRAKSSGAARISRAVGRCGAGLRPDPAGARATPVPPSGEGQGRGGVEAPVSDPHPEETVRGGPRLRGTKGRGTTGPARPWTARNLSAAGKRVRLRAPNHGLWKRSRIV